MYPVALQIGSLAIRWYGVMAAIGFLTAAWILERNRKYAGMNKDQCANVLLLSLLFGILGARIFYVVQFFDNFKHDLNRIWRIDQGGLVFYGGFLLALLAVVIYTQTRKLDTMRVLDALSPALAAAHGFGRIGCFLNGCCFGRATDAFWGITPPPESELAMQTGNLPLHPVQLLEAGENFVLAFFYYWLLRHTKRGVTVSSLMLIYGILRCFNETLRGDNVLYFHLTPAQWVGVLLIPAGAGLLWYFSRQNEKVS